MVETRDSSSDGFRIGRSAKSRDAVLYDSLAHVYDRWLSGDDAADSCSLFYVGKFANEPGVVLELGVGTGRIAAALSASGTRVIGLDVSQKMLSVAVAQTEGRVGLVCGRFEALPFPANAFAVVIMPMRTVGHLTNAADREATFREVYRVLQPGGRFVFDHYNLDLLWARSHDGRPRLMYAGPAIGVEDQALLIWDQYDYDFLAQQLRCIVRVEGVGIKGLLLDTSVVMFSFCWFQAEELAALGAAAGFAMRECWGSFDKAPYEPGSDHIVMELEKITE